jgi:RsiW-degrading membrane proteinase PrsW (M82 family)
MNKLLKNRGFWGIIVLIAMGAVLSVVMKDAEPWNLGDTEHLIFSITFSLIPGLLWLYFFYTQDKHEREPKHYMLGIFVIGMLLGYSFAYPIEQYFAESHVQSGSAVVELLWAILVFGTVQEVTKFIAVRYSVYNSKEFNEPADGVIYTVAAGLGFAAAYNIVYLNSLETINMSVVPVRVIEFYLVSAVFAGIMGYYMGKAKFESSGKETKMLTGFIIAIVLNGLYQFIGSQIQGMSYNVWENLLLSVVFVVIIYAIMFSMLQRSLESSPFKKNEA